MKKLFVLYGERNTGKTTSILRIIEKVAKISDHVIKDEVLQHATERCVIMCIKDTVIGIISKDDVAEELERVLHEFKEAGCNIIICPSRSRLKKDNNLDNFRRANHYEIKWIPKISSKDHSQQAACNAMDTDKLMMLIKFFVY